MNVALKILTPTNALYINTWPVQIKAIFPYEPLKIFGITNKIIVGAMILKTCNAKLFNQILQKQNVCSTCTTLHVRNQFSV